MQMEKVMESRKVELYGVEVAISETHKYCPKHNDIYECSDALTMGFITFSGDKAYIKEVCDDCGEDWKEVRIDANC